MTQWPSIFEKEFEYYKTPHHILFTWNPANADAEVVKLFEDKGFEFQKSVVLSASTVLRPNKYNPSVAIRPFTSEADWSAAVRLHVLCRDPGFEEKAYTLFKERQFETYRGLIRLHQGNRFGAFIDGKIVGDLGLFHRDGLGRYQNVITHPDFRRQGICGTLVYAAARVALDEWNVKTLVMEADPDYHAAAIYESVGFKPTEENYSLHWYDRQGFFT